MWGLLDYYSGSNTLSILLYYFLLLQRSLNLVANRKFFSKINSKLGQIKQSQFDSYQIRLYVPISPRCLPYMHLQIRNSYLMLMRKFVYSINQAY